MLVFVERRGGMEGQVRAAAAVCVAGLTMKREAWGLMWVGRWVTEGGGKREAI